MLTLRLIGPLPWATRRLMREMVSNAAALAVRHDLSVVVAPAPAVAPAEAPEGECGFGYFDPRGPRIVLAGRPPKELEDDIPGFLRSTLAHELAHYEQWRDGRRLQERGVAVRARTIERVLASL